MAQLTPEFLFDLESNMQIITANEYQRLINNLWYPRVMKTMESKSKRERLFWSLDTAKIERPNASHGGGQAIFEDLVMQTTEYENENAVVGLELKKEQLEDLDGNGVSLATDWSRQVGAQAAYWPQKICAAVIRDNGNTYDGLPFFSPIGAPHPVNPFNPDAGSFANDFTGAAVGIYPGAVPVDASVTIDVALNNLNAVKAYIASIVMPNGEDPRFLVVNAILHPPALTARMQQLTNAKFIAQAAAAGGGSGDVEAVIRNFGLGEPIEAPELGSAFGGSDTTYYILAQEITSDQLGAIVFMEREAFSVLFHGPQTDAQLARIRLFQWTMEGRNTANPGHPYLMFRCQGT